MATYEIKKTVTETVELPAFPFYRTDGVHWYKVINERKIISITNFDLGLAVELGPISLGHVMKDVRKFCTEEEFNEVFNKTVDSLKEMV